MGVHCYQADIALKLNRAGTSCAAEAVMEIWPVLEGLELRLGKWVVIARIGS